MPKNAILQKTCFVCHHSSSPIKNASSLRPGTAGPSGIVDLEGRPKELTEYILRTQLEVCPHCGYIAEDIGKRTSITKDFLQSPAYGSLQNPEIPPSPSLYQRVALIQLAENNPEKAIASYLSAAWCADSLLKPELAVSFRRKALSLIFSDNKTFADIPSKQWIPVLDTMRRCGDFDRVIRHVTSLLAIAGPALQQELDYELLCGDSEPHTNLDVVNSHRHRSGPQNTVDEFTIDGKSYSTEDDCRGRGWNWIAATRTLVLSNYHGSAIQATGDITIRLVQIDNQIESAHGPGIHLRHGNLKLSGAMFLSINGDGGGIFVDDGTLEMAGIFLKIRTKDYGIFTSGTITITDSCVIDVRSKTTAIKSVSGGLNASGKPVLKIFGMDAGIDLAGDLNQTEGIQQIESPNGCGIISHHGSLALTGCNSDFICGDTCINLENGSLSTKWMHGTLNGTSCVTVNGSCSITGSNITFSSVDFGLFVSKDMEISNTKCESSGKTAIAVGGKLQIQNVNISASGGMGISVGGDIKCAGGILMLQGDTAMQISGAAEISNAQIMGVGKISGIVVHGSYSQSGGDISFSGDAQEGMRVFGKEMRINSGSLKVSGRKSGLDVDGDVALENVALLSASGNIGFSCKSLKIIKNVNIKATGEEIGLSIRGGNLFFGDTITVNATGNVGIYATHDIGIHGGTIQVTGQFAGIVMESGNLIITNGAIDIFGEEFGILLQSGSMEVFSGIIDITNSRMTDSGGCGIAVEKGNLAAGGIMTINGESYAISVPSGEIFMRRGMIEAYGFRAGITGKSMKLNDVSLTAYGKTEGAVVLTGQDTWNDEGVVILAGKSTKTATDTIYSDQKYVHAYSVHLPDAS
ncbi:MAG: hypothetical protein M0R30_14315 [Methanoregula sp.]|jgi:hypothetical protein|uniref:hypothetical protein n=1 Tax=Methanoregula sp. TaxID=2052170 RepID=UPI0025F4F9B9|nr:hypothetical protein [Methanoregula sp.]MCK9632801.1 hypothetical protein [Methanoregula sp.]